MSEEYLKILIIKETYALNEPCLQICDKYRILIMKNCSRIFSDIPTSYNDAVHLLH